MKRKERKGKKKQKLWWILSRGKTNEKPTKTNRKLNAPFFLSFPFYHFKVNFVFMTNQS